MLRVMFMAWAKSKRASKIRAVGRVAAYCGVVAGVAGLFAAHSAHASVAEGALQFGRDMMPLREYLQEPTPLTLNGQNMVLATGFSTKGAHEILDNYETFCRASKDAQGKDWSNLMNEPLNGPKAASKLAGVFDMGVYRSEKNGEGTVMCFMRGSDSQKTLTESLQAFDRTHDLGTLGKMRYAYVKNVEGGRSMVFTAWTDDHFRIDSFIPQGTEDTAGSDPVGLPRPPQSQRLLSAELRGSPFGAHVYRSTATPDQVRDYYDGEMMKLGFAPLGWGDEKVVPGKNRIYLKGSTQIALATKTDGTGTIVSVGELGATPTESSEK
ncbi:MAG TPA: hypothetical protein VNO21_05370 [Polyangiaceae bacterium]|nr:hypothetical protein [Polyangiaceae bacterium]